MNIFTFTKQVATLCLCLFFSISLKSQCGEPDGSIIVTSIADEGVGTLRDAINCANILANPSRIIFNISTNDRAVILVGSTSGQPLPSIINNGTIIDGSTQNGFGVNGNFQPKIVLDGSVPTWSSPINALKVFGNDTEIYALEIRNFPDDGIDVDNADNVVLGDIEKGNVIYNCGIEQDFFPDAPNSGPYNGVGIVVSENAENIEIIGNIIGTDYDRNPNLGNEWCGIYIRRGADFAIIEGNIITDHEIGIRIRNSFAIQISENEMTCNSRAGIQFVGGANDDKIAPSITSASNVSISGTGDFNNEIEIFIADNCIDSVCQGHLFLGRAIVQEDRTWRLSAPYANDIAITGDEVITATATDGNNRTSRFSVCQNTVFQTTCAPIDGIIWVNTTDDEGEGSLRAAIECANTSPGPNTIRFNINEGGRQQINVGSTSGKELPFLRDGSTVIDATTQPGFGDGGIVRPLIVLDGASNNWTYPHNALWIRADNCEIYGLEIRNFPDDGIDITAGDFNIIGAPGKGNIIYNCGSETDFFIDHPGTGPWNGCGIVLKNGAQNTSIQGNIIGTDFSQTNTIGNELCGIIIQSGGENNLIGGTETGEGNIIAYNEVGVSILGNAYNNRLLGNSFYCNENSGIDLSSDANNNQTSPNINIASISVINGTGINGEVIEIYAISNTCADGPCQGSTLLGTATVANLTWRLTEPFLNGVTLVAGDKITALATNPAGNTSEFAECREIAGIEPPTECNINLGISNFGNETCAGNDGMFTLSTNGATLPVTYNSGNGSTDNPSFSSLSAGVYSITVTDADGCTADLSVAITQQSSPALNVVNTSNENCGQADGSVTLVASDGQSPYIYELGNGQISRTPTFNNLSAGSYTIIVTDANNCTASQSISIQQTGNINVSIADMRSDNCNGSNGSFRLAASGGAEPYTYNLGNGVVSNNLFSGLSAGNYEVTVADANNCSTVANVNVSGSSAPVLAIDNVTPATCSQSTGSATLSVNGGRAPFLYNIGNGNVNNPSFSNLSAGNYILTVTDANNCTATQAITIDEPAPPSLSIISSQNASCGNANGTVSMLSVGGQSPYLYDIGWGITSDPNFSNLTEGSYTVTVTDNNGCKDEMALNISNTPTPVVEVASFQNASCDQNNAILTVSGLTGEAPFTYDVGNGPSNNPIFQNLGAGNYTVTMTDNNNCTASVSVEIKNTGGPQLNILNTSEARCGKENGSFSVSSIGGFEPFTYDIGNGPKDNPEFYDLAGGNYVVTLTDANGCTATQSVTLGNIPPPTFGIGNITMATCGESNAGFSVSAFGGLAPYQFNIGGANTTDPYFSDLSEGSYTVIVTDANNCSSVLNVVVEGTDMPEVDIISNSSSQCGQASGSFELEVKGGIAPYFFDIGDGETTDANFANLFPGNYSVTISDASNCSLVREIEIGGSSEIAMSIKNKLPAACGAANGSFTLSPSGGVAPYVYSINNQTFTDSIFTDFNEGTYDITATDANGCSIITTVKIDGSTGPAVSIDVNHQCGDKNAAIFVKAAQGKAPYTYDIGNGPSSNPNFLNVKEGLYSVSVRDANGCESAQRMYVNTSAKAPYGDAIITTTPSCGQSDGSFQINMDVGIPPYQYTIKGKPASEFSSFTNLSAGNYEVLVTDASGCSTMIPVALQTEGGMPLAAFDVSLDDFVGTFSNTTENGTSYLWNFGDGNSSAISSTTNTFSSEGTYTICLTASNDCGRDTYCEEITIESLNANKSFEFDFGEVSGQVGETIKIPVYVKNFKAIVGFQKSVHLIDTAAAKIVGITDLNLDYLSVSLFSLKDYSYSMTWFDGSIEGFNLPDSTIIYQIEVELLTDNLCTEIVIKDAPLETQVYQKIGSNEIEVDYFKRRGKICVGEENTGNLVSNINGFIASPLNLPISEVTITCTNVNPIINKLDGTYLLENLPIPNKYEISPNKTANPTNGITTFDLVLIQNHILGKTILETPYKIIAADVNKSGSITVSDVLELRKLLLSTISEFSNNDSWRFIAEDYEFDDSENPLKENFPESISLNLSDKKLSANFIGIKIGDVNDSVNPNALLANEERSKKEGTFILKVKDQYLNKGEVTDVTFYGNELSQILGFQYTMHLNQKSIVVESIKTNTLFNETNIGENLINRGYLLASWVNVFPEQTGKNDPLFTLEIKAKKAGRLSQLIQINSHFLAAEAYNSDGKIADIQLNFSNSEIISDDNFELFQNKPNPFSQSTVINYQLPEEGKIQLDLFDIQGKLLKSFQRNGKRGRNEILIQRSEITTSGILYYKLSTPFGQLTKKMLIIE